MTKSTITREQLLEIIETDHVQCGEASYLARMALAAMDSEPVAYMYRQVQELRNRFGTCDEWEINCRLVESDFPAVEIPESEDYEFLPLYRHAQPAQPAPVVPDEVLEALQKVARLRLDLKDFDGDRRGIADCLGDAEDALIEVVNRRDAMLHAGNSPAQSPIDHGYLPECECSGCKATARICAELAGNSQVIPDGYVMVPKEPTDEMLAAAKEWTGLTSTAEVVYIKMLAAAPQSPGSEPATVPGKWIPVSERMPDENAEQQVLACFKGGDISTLYYFEGRWDDAYGIVPIRQDVTHWIPLPAAPQEVK